MASAATKIMEKTARWVAKQAQKRAPVGGDNRFLEGAYAPVASETTSTKLKVTGTIPKELDGILARIGPNPIHAPNPATYHWFVGDGMVHFQVASQTADEMLRETLKYKEHFGFGDEYYSKIPVTAEGLRGAG